MKYCAVYTYESPMVTPVVLDLLKCLKCLLTCSGPQSVIVQGFDKRFFMFSASRTFWLWSKYFHTPHTEKQLTLTNLSREKCPSYLIVFSGEK